MKYLHLFEEFNNLNLKLLNQYIETALGGIDSKDFQRRFFVLRNNEGEDNLVVKEIRKIAELNYIILNNIEPTFYDIQKVAEYHHLFLQISK